MIKSNSSSKDDQTDHFDYESNSWLSEKEKEAQRKKREAEDAAMEEDKRKIKITLDLAGRRIVEQTGAFLFLFSFCFGTGID